MTYEQISGQNNQQLDLSSLGLEIGTNVKCKVIATGVNDLGNPVSIDQESNPVQIVAGTPDPPEEVFRYSGTFNLVPLHSNNISYKAPASTVEFEGFGEGLPSGNIDIDGRATGSNNMGMRWNCPGGAGSPGEPSQYLLDYTEQPWDLIVTTTDGTLNSDPTSVNVGTNTFSYYWGNGSLDRFTNTTVTLRERDLQLGSDAWPLDPEWFPWGEGPTFTLTVAGATPPPPDPTNDSWEALKSRLSTPDESGEVDLGGLVYCIQNEFELEDYFNGIGINGLNATVKNGSITGAFNPNLLTWSEVGDGTYKASLPEAIVNSPSFDRDYTRWQLVDHDQEGEPFSHPLYQIRVPGDDSTTGAQPPSEDFSPHRWTWTSDWITYNSLNRGNPTGSNSPYGNDGIWNEGDQGWHPDDGFRVEREVNAEGGARPQDVVVLSVSFADNDAGDEYLAQFNKATNGAFEPGSDKWRDLTILVHHYPNLIRDTKLESWDPDTRTMVFTRKFAYNYYFRFAFNGVDVDSPTESLEVGEYFWDPGDDINPTSCGLLYKPIDPSFIQDHIDNPTADNVPKVYIPAVAKLFDLSSCDIKLNDLEIFSQHGNSPNAYFIVGKPIGTGVESTITFEGCKTYATNQLTKDMIVFAKENTFIDTNKRFIGGFWGVIERNFFGNSYNQSVLNFGGQWDDGSHDVRPDGSKGVIVKDNFFTLEASAHGQCIANYGSNWQNVLIEHNIFYNCKAVLSYQPTASKSEGYDQEKGDRGNMGEYIFANNLVYMDNLAIVPVDQGQSGLAFNGDASYHVSSKQKVKWLSNTMWTNTTYENDSNAEQNHINMMQVTLNKHTTEDLVVANNICRSFRYTNPNEYKYFYGAYNVLSDDTRVQAKEKFENFVDSNGINVSENVYGDDEEKYGVGVESLRQVLPREIRKTVSVCNAIYGRNTQTAPDLSGRGYGRSDLPDLPYRDVDGGAINPDGVFNEDTLQPVGLWATSASDAGRLGIRWSSTPTVAQLEEINENREFNWSDRFSAQLYPQPVDNDSDDSYDSLEIPGGSPYIFNDQDRANGGDDFRPTP